MKKEIILMLIITLSSLALAMPNSLSINGQVEDNGNVSSGSFIYNFTLSTQNNCANPVFNYRKTIVTDSRGIFSVEIPDVNVNFSTNDYRLCVYRDGVLKSNKSIGFSPYTAYSLNSNYSLYSNSTTYFGGNLSSQYVLYDSIPFCPQGLYLTKIDGIGWFCDELIIPSSGHFNSTYHSTSLEWNGNKSVLLGLVNNGSYLSTFNSTYNQWAYNMTTPFINWLSTFLYNYNQTTPAISYTDNKISGLDNSTIVREGTSLCLNQVVQNVTINESGIFTQCIPITSNGDGSFNSTYDITTKDVNANRSLWFSTYNSSYESKFNSTYDSHITNLTLHNNTFNYNQTSIAISYIDNKITGLDNSTIVRSSTSLCLNQIVQNITINSSGIFTTCIPITSTGDGSFNSTYDLTSKDVAANRSSWFSTFNSSYESTFNSSYNSYAYNQTTPAISYADTTFVKISDLPLENRTKVNWNNLTNVPAGFADGVDNTGAGATEIFTLATISQSITNNDTQGGSPMTNMNFSIGANEVWSGEVYTYSTLSGAPATSKYRLDVPSGAVVSLYVVGAGTNFRETIANATWTGDVISVTPGHAKINFLVINGGNAGEVRLFGATKTSGTLTIVGNRTWMLARQG